MKELALDKKDENFLTENEIRLKRIIKIALKEIFVEEKDFLFTQLVEFMEDIAFGKLIKEGDRGDYVSEKEVFEVLRG